MWLQYRKSVGTFWNPKEVDAWVRVYPGCNIKMSRAGQYHYAVRFTDWQGNTVELTLEFPATIWPDDSPFIPTDERAKQEARVSR